MVIRQQQPELFLTSLNVAELFLNILRHSRLDSQHYYWLDGHLNAKGHQVVAEAILQRID
jgi:lysophospholipase L1-like esterase